MLGAANGHQAIRMYDDHGDLVHLLITDVVIPDMNGRQLAEALNARSPDLRVIYVSGYPTNVIAHQGVIDESLEFLHKAFDSKSLLQRVRAILDTAQSDYS